MELTRQLLRFRAYAVECRSVDAAIRAAREQLETKANIGFGNRCAAAQQIAFTEESSEVGGGDTDTELATAERHVREPGVQRKPRDVAPVSR